MLFRSLRRANCFSGTNLSLARNPLRIPATHTNGAAVIPTAVPVNSHEGPMSRDSQIRTVMQAAGVQRTEAICFLELHDWNVTQAVADARSDYHVTNNGNIATTISAMPEVKGAV